MRLWGEIFASSHLDLIHSSNSYHNHIHSAEAIFSAAIFLETEFNQEMVTKYAPYLLFAMMCHDIEHNGSYNKKPYELEILAVKAMKRISNSKEMVYHWNKEIKLEYGNIERFQRIVSRIILGTEFTIGLRKNIKSYLKNNKNPFVRLNLLANESDIFIAVLEKYGFDKGLILAEEQKKPELSTIEGRLYFLEHLAKYNSEASEKLGIKKHIYEQIKILKNEDTKRLKI